MIPGYLLQAIIDFFPPSVLSGLRTFLASSSPNKKNFSYKENTLWEVIKKKKYKFPLTLRTGRTNPTEPLASCSILLPGPLSLCAWGTTNALPSKCLQQKLHVISCVYLYEYVHMFIYGVHVCGVYMYAHVSGGQSTTSDVNLKALSTCF